MMTGANATIDYLYGRVEKETDFVPTIQTFVVNQAKLVGTPSLNLTSPSSQTFVLGTDFSVREGAGTLSGPVTFLVDGGCNLAPGSLTGLIAVFVAQDLPCA